MSTIKARENFLDIESPIIISDNLEFVDYIDYRPPESSLNANGNIRLVLEDADGFCLLDQSEFIISVDLEKADDTRYVAADVVSLINNGIMYLFNEVTFKMADKTIEHFTNVGHVSNILGLLKYKQDFSKTSGITQCWSLDSGTGAAALANEGFAKRNLALQNNPIGQNEYIIPFNHLFGFQGKILNGIKCEVLLSRVLNDDILYRVNTAAAGKIKITALKWRVPYLRLKPEEYGRITSLLSKNVDIPMGFYVKKLNYTPMPQALTFSHNVGVESDRLEGIIVFFQTLAASTQLTNSATYHNLGLKNISCLLNKKTYPGFDLHCDFTTGQYKTLYKRYIDFRRKFYNVDLPEITESEYKNLYPIIVFDLSNQVDRSNGGLVHVAIEASFANAVPANTNCYILMIYEKRFSLNSVDGSHMKLIY